MKKLLSSSAFFYSVMALLSAFLIIFLVNIIKDDSTHYTDCYVFSQSLVTEKLKSPKSAHFPAYSSDFISEKDGKVYVTAYVDAQNSLGATVRTNYIATIEVNSNGKPARGYVTLN